MLYIGQTTTQYSVIRLRRKSIGVFRIFGEGEGYVLKRDYPQIWLQNPTVGAVFSSLLSPAIENNRG